MIPRVVPEFAGLLKYFNVHSIPIYYISIMSADFVTTIDSDDEVSNYGGEGSTSKPTKAKKGEDEELDPDFEFDFGNGGSAGVDLWGGDEVRVGDKGKDVSLTGHWEDRADDRLSMLMISLQGGLGNRSRRIVSERERGLERSKWRRRVMRVWVVMMTRRRIVRTKRRK
jgi:hypothetical protein